MKKPLFYLMALVILNACTTNKKTRTEYYFDQNGQTENVHREFEAIIEQNASGNEIEVLNGDFKEYYENGTLAKHVIFRNNLLWNSISSFDSLGNPIAGPVVKDGNGVHFDYHPNGKPKYRIEISNGLPHGAFNAFRRNGKELATASYSNGQRNGLSKIFHTNGQEFLIQTYHDDILVETEKMFDLNGTLLHETEYKSPPFNSMDSFHLGIGKIARDGGLSSIISSWIPIYGSGKGIKDGKDFGYYPNGNLENENHYFDAIQDSIMRHYHENGTVQLEYYTDRKYENMKRFEVTYDIDGNIIDSATFNRRR